MSDKLETEEQVSEVQQENVLDSIQDISAKDEASKYNDQAQKALQEAIAMAKNTALEVVNSNKERFPFLIANKGQSSVYDKAKEWNIGFLETAQRIEDKYRDFDTKKYQELQKHLSPSPITSAPAAPISQDMPYIPGQPKYEAPSNVKNIQNHVQNQQIFKKKGSTASVADMIMNSRDNSRNMNPQDIINGTDTTKPVDSVKSVNATYRRAMPSHLTQNEMLDMFFSNIKPGN